MNTGSPNNLRNTIEDFLHIFRSHLDFVYNTELPNYEKLYKKTICFGIIDTLSKTVFPNERSNRNRFVGFVEKFSKDDIWNRVSLSHLVKLLEFAKDPAFDDLSRFVSEIISNPHSNFDRPMAIAVDPEYEKVKILWPTSTNVIKDISLERITHKHLFYEYRNYIIHELRRPGGVSDDDIAHQEPFYYALFNMDENRSSWKLAYPLGFCVRICETVLRNLEAHYLMNQINPSEVFDKGFYFLRLLNQPIDKEQ